MKRESHDHAELPPIPGPKLQAFKDRNEPVEFLDLLSSPPNGKPNKSSQGPQGHAHVFKVRIKREIYALKVFKFFPIALLRSLFPPRNRKVDAAKMSYQSDPFFAECRAYGKINGILGKYRRSEARGRRSRLKAHEKVRPKARAQRELAVPCYGFMELPSVPYEQHLLTKYNIDDWNREESDLQLPKERRAPFRAIVKKLMPNTEPIRDPSQMRRDLMDLQKSGIAQNDVALRNYMDGLLVDFSSAWTEPHWAKEVLPMSSWKRQLEDDFLEFDFMMKKADVKLRPLARSLDIYGKLRDRPGTPRADVQKYCGPRKLEAGLVK